MTNNHIVAGATQPHQGEEIIGLYQDIADEMSKADKRGESEFLELQSVLASKLMKYIDLIIKTPTKRLEALVANHAKAIRNDAIVQSIENPNRVAEVEKTLNSSLWDADKFHRDSMTVKIKSQQNLDAAMALLQAK